jgi:glycosyltransferase involved in cell wall biosynthesis
MKKICLVIHSLGIGGMERVMAQLANHFSESREAEVHLVLIGIRRNVDYPLSPGIKVHRPSFPFSNSRRTADTIRTMLFLRKKVKEIDPHTILSFGEMWNNLVLLSLYGLDYPVYLSDRSQPEKNLGRLHNRLRNRLYTRAAGYIAQTEKAAEICLANGWNRSIEVIGNPVREVEPDPAIEKENIVLFVGRLIPTKHVDQLIEMFMEINMPGWKLCIVGGDAKRLKISEELEQLVNKLGAGENVLLEGQQKDVDSYYNRSKIFAFTSSSEGFPNVVGEALSAGLPVVAYDCIAGPSDMIEDGENGFLIPLFDRETFKNALQRLMEDKALRDRMGRMAVKKIKEFEAGEIAGRFYDFITNTKPAEKEREASVK